MNFFVLIIFFLFVFFSILGILYLARRKNLVRANDHAMLIYPVLKYRFVTNGISEHHSPTRQFRTINFLQFAYINHAGLRGEFNHSNYQKQRDIFRNDILLRKIYNSTPGVFLGLICIFLNIMDTFFKYHVSLHF